MTATALHFPSPLSSETLLHAETQQILRKKLDLILATLSELRREISGPGGVSFRKDEPKCARIEDDVIECAPRRPLPQNVVPVGRDLFRTNELPPPEAALDPALERATVQELNDALAAAFSHMSAP